MLANLKRNDEVITAGGLYGKIVALTDKVVTLEIAPNVRVRVDRPQIAVAGPPRRPAGRQPRTKRRIKRSEKLAAYSIGSCSSWG